MHTLMSGLVRDDKGINLCTRSEEFHKGYWWKFGLHKENNIVGIS